MKALALVSLLMDWFTFSLVGLRWLALGYHDVQFPFHQVHLPLGEHALPLLQRLLVKSLLQLGPRQLLLTTSQLLEPNMHRLLTN